MSQPAPALAQTTAGSPVRSRTLARAAIAVVAGSIVASLLDTVVAAIWHAAGASKEFNPLHPSAYVVLTVLGLIAGTVGWSVVRARAGDPARVLRVLVPVVLLLSFIPDVLVGAAGDSAMSGTTWGAVSGLMVMHVLVAAVAITAFRLLLPLPASRR